MDLMREAPDRPPLSPDAHTGRQKTAPLWVVNCVGVSFLDSNGVWWCVSERPCQMSGAPDRQCLVFMSETVARRIFNFPADWRTFTPAQFETLSWQR